MLFYMYIATLKDENTIECHPCQQQFILCMILGWFAKTDQA